jgi:hypothetical protein
MAEAARPAPGDLVCCCRASSQRGYPADRTICALLGCSVQYGLGDPQGQVFLVTSNLNLTPDLFLNLNLGVLDTEVDVRGRIMDAVNQGSTPAALFDSTPSTTTGRPFARATSPSLRPRLWNSLTRKPPMAYRAQASWR